MKSVAILVGLVMLVGCTKPVPYVSPQDRLAASLTPQEIEAQEVCRNLKLPAKPDDLGRDFYALQKDLCNLQKTLNDAQLCLYSKTDADLKKYCEETK